MTHTKDSLKELISGKLMDYKLIIVSNREPYVHNYVGEEIKCIIPASGMVTALDPIIRAGGGTWERRESVLVLTSASLVWAKVSHQSGTESHTRGGNKPCEAVKREVSGYNASEGIELGEEYESIIASV